MFTLKSVISLSQIVFQLAGDCPIKYRIDLKKLLLLKYSKLNSLLKMKKKLIFYFFRVDYVTSILLLMKKSMAFINN